MERPKTKTKLKPPDGHARNYSSLIREANSFNGRLLAERTSRLPFIDNQTGVAQSDCNLWRSEKERVRCQANDTQSSWNESRLYSYPSLARWNRPQRSFEQTRMSRNSVNLCRLPGASASCGAPAYGLELAVNKERAGPMRAATYTTMNNRDQQRPPRADSTGSHSFADSDSRDQSSTGTSQSVESPRSQMLDDEQPLCNLNYLAIGDEDKGRGKRSSPGQNGERELSVGIGQDSYQVMRKSKLSRGKNMGSSLIKSVEQSLLIKSNRAKITNGRKTPQNGRGARLAVTNKSSSLSSQTKSVPCGSKQARDARPYVCPICDQTYKTRPGLSYHFVHSHDTVLPRNLPVKIESDKPMESKRANGSTTGAWKPKKKRPARVCMKQEEPITRVLRRGRTAAYEHDEIHEKANALLDELTHEHALTEESNRIEQVVSNQVSDQNTNFQETKEPAPTGVVGLDKCHSELEDDDNETVIEMSLSRSSPADEAILSKSPSTAIGGGDTGKKWPHENGNEPGQDDRATHKIDGEQTEPTTGQSRTNNRRSIFCDFCLGTVDKNRRTCLPEELISCSNCGSSGHPSCLRFSENICRSVKKYNWQCLECKTCSTCDQADHEDQMLFCDDCDRSYHTYCLSPRLERPPEGSWTCRECLDEYYKEDQK